MARLSITGAVEGEVAGRRHLVPWLVVDPCSVCMKPHTPAPKNAIVGQPTLSRAALLVVAAAGQSR